MIDDELQKKERFAKAEALLLKIPLRQAQVCARILSSVTIDWDFDNDFMEGYIKDAELVRLLFNAMGEEVRIIAGKGKGKQILSYPADDLLGFVLFSSTIGRDLSDARDPEGYEDEEGNEVIERGERTIMEVLAGFWKEFDIDSMIARTKALKSDKNTWIPKAGMIAAALDEILQYTDDFFSNQTQRRSFVYKLMEAGFDADFYKHRVISEANIESGLYETWESAQARCVSQMIEAYNRSKANSDDLNSCSALQYILDYEFSDETFYFPKLFANGIV